jgi:hypothetical protein
MTMNLTCASSGDSELGGMSSGWITSPSLSKFGGRIEAAEMKLLRPLAGYTLNDHKTNDSVRRELQTECILDKTDEHRRNWLLHLQRMPLNHITTDHKEEEQLADRRNVGESSCNSGDGTDQRVQSLMFMMMMMNLTFLIYTFLFLM